MCWYHSISSLLGTYFWTSPIVRLKTGAWSSERGRDLRSEAERNKAPVFNRFYATFGKTKRQGAPDMARPGDIPRDQQDISVLGKRRRLEAGVLRMALASQGI